MKENSAAGVTLVSHVGEIHTDSGPRSAPASSTRIRASAVGEAEAVLPRSQREIDMRSLLSFSAKSGASDLHLVGGQPASLRVHGVMQRIKMRALAPEEVRDLVTSIMDEGQQADLAAGLEVDF